MNTPNNKRKRQSKEKIEKTLLTFRNDSELDIDELKKALKPDCRVLFIASSPDDVERTEEHAFAMKDNFERSGFTFSEYILLDRRSEAQAKELLAKADFAVLPDNARRGNAVC